MRLSFFVSFDNPTELLSINQKKKKFQSRTIKAVNIKNQNVELIKRIVVADQLNGNRRQPTRLFREHRN